MLTRKVRFAAFLGGVLLWIGYPVAYWFGIHTRWLGRCEHRAFTGRFDDCYNDLLPFFDMFWAALAWILTLLFAKVAEGIWMSRDRPGMNAWVRSDDPAFFLPFGFCLALLGVAWTVWNFVTIPFEMRFAGLLVYWAVFCVWFVAGVIVTWMRPIVEASDGED